MNALAVFVAAALAGLLTVILRRSMATEDEATRQAREEAEWLREVREEEEGTTPPRKRATSDQKKGA